MVFRSGKEIDNKVREEEHDEVERLKSIESDHESEKENESSPSPIMPDPTVTYKPRVP